MDVCSILRTLGRIIVHQLLEHLLPAGELYIYKSVCVVQIAAVHTEKVFDALVKLWLIVVQEEQEISQILFLQGRQDSYRIFYG